MSPERLLSVLEFLRNRYAEKGATPKTKLHTLEVHNAYLQLAAKDKEQFPKLLPQLRFLNQAQAWQAPDRLCAGAVGIDPEHALEQTQEEILRSWVKVQQPRELGGTGTTTGPRTCNTHLEAEYHRAVRDLQQYFTPWAHAAEEVGWWVGAFLSFLGSYPPLRQLSEKHLPRGHSPEAVWSAAGLRPRERNRQEESVGTMMNLQRFLVEVRDLQPHVHVINLLGQSIVVKKSQHVESLLIGYGVRQLEVRLEDDVQVHWLCLQEIDPRKLRPEELRSLLSRTAAHILRKVYHQKDTSLDPVLRELTEGEEPGVKNAQEEFLIGAGHSLRQFGLNRLTVVQPVFQLYDAMTQREAEEQTALEQGRKLEGEPATAKKQKAKQELRHLLLTNADVRAGLLDGVRRKLRDFRYREESILFELFQNADDAYVELEIKPPAQFSLTVVGEGITVMHAGRRINHPVGTEGEAAGQTRDLVKMLALNHSDKGQEGCPVTGRFGLGFKSVFLVCDQPRAVSGRLGFEVLGGVFPRPLDKESADQLGERLDNAGFRRQEATAFELRLSEPSLVEKVFARFRQLAHFLLAFARCIRKCSVLEQEQPTELSWTETVLVESGGVRVTTGTLHPLGTTKTAEPRQALVIRSQHGDFLLGITPRGVTKLLAEVPTVWVVAPTQECHDLGWIVNGAFTLDVGRAQVDWSAAANRDLVTQLGTAVGTGLITLFDLAVQEGGWQRLAAQFHLAPETSFQDFWVSLWKLMANARRDVPKPLHDLLWHPNTGALTRLYSERPALPTGLQVSPHKGLTSIPQITAVLEGVLDDPKYGYLLTQACSLAGLQSLSAGTLISQRAVGSDLRTLAPDLTQGWLVITLASLLAQEVAADRHVSHGRADRYGQLVTSNLLREMEWPANHSDEARCLRNDVLHQAQFRADNCSWKPAHGLLIPYGEDQEERMLAAFAPPSRVLAPEYLATSAAWGFVRLCRGELEILPQQLLEWAMGAKEEPKQEAVLTYVLQGNLGYQLRHYIRDIPWLAALESSQLLERFSLNQRYELLGRLGLVRSPLQERGLVPLYPQPSQIYAPHEALRHIARWWQNEGDYYLHQYEQNTYPDGRLMRLSADPPENDFDARREWLLLFLTGMLLTLGRNRVWRSHHRRFLNLCQQEGWLDLLADPSAGSEAWLHAVESYIDDPRKSEKIPYFHWLRQFIGIATIARHLDAYVACFLAPDSIEGKFSLQDLLSPRSSAHFQGTEVDAPPLPPILGIGALFVLRELVRWGLVKNRRTHRYCYPPFERLRNFLMDRLGWRAADSDSVKPWKLSRAIYDFLREHCPENPTFNGAFDLPVLILAEDEKLCEQVLGSVPPSQAR